MADTYFCGLRATGDLVTNELADNWRAGILRIFPNGMAPLTGLTALMTSEKLTEGPHYHWWTKTLTTQRATVTGIYTDTALGTAYTSGGVAGSILYVKMSEADSAYFRAGHQVLLRDASDYNVDVNAKVLSVTANGASSYIVVRLLEADDNATATSHDLSDADTCLIVGNINPQGGTRPEAITQGPTEFSNYTQIFRNSLDLARTLMQTRLRTGDAYQEAKKDALEQHSIEMEKAFFWGIQSSNTGANGKPETTTDGIVPLIKTYGTTSDYSLDTNYSGKTWLDGGADWLDEQLEVIFRYGSQERLGFAGSGAILGIQKLVKELGFYTVNVQTTSFGMKVLEWVTPFGSLYLKTHPLFSYEATTRNSVVLIEPKNIKYRFIQDTMFKADNTDTQGGGTGKDGKEEEYLTECGLEMHYPLTCGYLNGFNTDSAV